MALAAPAWEPVGEPEDVKDDRVEEIVEWEVTLRLEFRRSNWCWGVKDDLLRLGAIIVGDPSSS